MELTKRSGGVVAAFPVTDNDQIMLVTDGGQVIRCAVGEISITGRRTQGVWVFRVDEGEKVVSVGLAGDENGDDVEVEGEEETGIDEGGNGDTAES